MGRHIVTSPGGPFPGSSADTWETLAQRATSLSGKRVTVPDLIAENVGRQDPPIYMVNDWLKSIGGFRTITHRGIETFIFPAGFQVRLPFGVTVADNEAAAPVSLTVQQAQAMAQQGDGKLLVVLLVIAIILVVLFGGDDDDAKATEGPPA